MNVLITGADGFLGQKILNRVLDKNNSVLAFVYNVPVNEKRNCDKELKYIKVDFSKKINFEKILENHNIDVVIHCAFITTITSFDDFNDNAISVNILTTINLISYSAKHKINKFIYLSSAGIYLNQSKNNINYENRKIKFDSNYFFAKNIIENILEQYNKFQINTKFITLRIGTIYGENEFISFSRKNLSLPILILNKIVNNEVIKINRLDIYRDYCYIDDISIAISEIINKSNLKYSLINIGSSEVYSLKDIFNIMDKHKIIYNLKICKKKNCNIFLNETQNRSGLGLNRIKNLIDNYPIYSFETGIMRTYNRMKSNV